MVPARDLWSDHIPWLWIFLAAGVFLYLPFIGGVHLFDWDEINFAEISREMVVTGDYLSVQVDYMPFYEKPPFFFWLQTVSMHMFGINEFAARLPNVIGGLLVIVLLFKLGTHWVNRRFAILWTLSYLGSILPLLYHKSGIIDPWFNMFIFSGIAAWIEGGKRNETKWFILSGMMAGLALLTKGPVGPLIMGLAIMLIRLFSKDNRMLTFLGSLLFIMACVVVGGSWFAIEWLANGPEFITAFIKYQAELLNQSVAGHKGFPGYHFINNLIGVFPASLFALAALRKKQEDETSAYWQLRLSMLILLGIVLILFTVVQSKIVHYSSLVYYPLTFLSAWTLDRMFSGNYRLPGWQKIIGAVVSMIIFLLLVGLPVVGLMMEKIKASFSFDAFTRASLDAKVAWHMIDFIPAIWFVFMIAASWVLWKRRKTGYSILTLFLGTGILVNLFLIFFIGKIEHYSQRSAIEFYKSKEGQQVEIDSYGFHSYAPFFYAKKPQPYRLVSSPKLYVVKVDKKEELLQQHNVKFLYEKNGFAFFSE